MAIQVTCKCGRQFNVKSQWAGKQAKCPVCGSVLTIPQQGAGPGPSSVPGQQPFFPSDVPAAPGAAAPRFPSATPAAVNPYAPSQTVEPQAAYGGGVIPARAAAILRQYPPPTGSCAEWPLADHQLADLRQTELLRRRIRHAAVATRFVFWLTAIGAVINWVQFFILLGLGPRRGPPAEAVLLMLLVLLIATGLPVLYFLAQAATVKCRRWGPLTVAILQTIGIAIIVVLMFVSLANVRADEVAVVVLVFPLLTLVPAIIAILNYLAFAAIPAYLNQPVWCQEALINSKL